MPVRLPDGRNVDFRVTHTTDLTVILEVIYKGQYELPELPEPEVIVDAGSHIGASVAWFASRYPECRIVGFEASRTTYECLRENVRSFPNVEVHNIALAGRDGYGAVIEAAAPWASSVKEGSDPDDGDVVPTMTLDSVLSMVGGRVDLLKLDIEGAEYEVLRACPPDPMRVAHMVGESHTWMEDAGFTQRDLLDLMGPYEVEEDESGGERLFRATPRVTGA